MGLQDVTYTECRCAIPLKALCTVQWQPTREGYLRFLVESKEVYNTLESIVTDAQHSDCKFPAVRVLAHCDIHICLQTCQ